MRVRTILRGFVEGMASAFGASRFDIHGYPHRNDAEALHSDWRSVGKDLRRVIDNLSKTLNDSDPR
jgi:hypothetical protein